MKLAVMQPYIFPYLGYFHLIEATDKIIFYDDVNYIRRGWINRNRILMNGKDKLFTIPVKEASQNNLIRDTMIFPDEKKKHSLLETIRSAYSKAPFFKETFELVNNVFNGKYDSIAGLAVRSVVDVYAYLGKEINWDYSSVCCAESKGLEKADRLIEISKNLGYESYVNTPGGKELYSRDYFRENGINLYFIKSELLPYKQLDNNFIPGLSVIDVLMFNSKEDILKHFSSWKLE